MAYLGKTFKFVSQENFDAFVDSLNISEEMSQKYKLSKPTTKIVKNADGSFTITTVFSPDTTRSLTFTPGVEFEEKISADRTAKTTINVEGDTFTQVQIFKEGTITMTREFTSATDLKTTFKTSTWSGVAYRYLKAE